MKALPAPGAIIAGDYRVVRPLSHGHQTAVYVVEQLSTQRQRALKLMRPELVASDEQRRRFEQEAKVGARIPSGHVVEVQAAGVDPQLGLPYLVMELLVGETLDAAISRTGPFSAAVTRQVFAQICHALGAAHHAGVVHGALEPSQVFLAAARRTDVTYTVKVLDFGIARLIAEQTAVTATLEAPLWLAPEQLERRAVTAATDVWTLGLLAFFALTGSVYWRAGAQPQSPTLVIDELLRAPLVPASTRAAELGQPLPVAIDDWFARAVARTPAGRFANARDAFQALAPLLGPVSSPAPAVLPHAVTSGSPAGTPSATTQASQGESDWGSSATHTTFRGTGESDWEASATHTTFRGSGEWGSGTIAEPAGTALVTKRRRVGWALGCLGLSSVATAVGLVIAGGIALWIWSSRASSAASSPESSATPRDPATRELDPAAEGDMHAAGSAEGPGPTAADSGPRTQATSRPAPTSDRPRTTATTPVPTATEPAPPPVRLKAGAQARASIAGLPAQEPPYQGRDPVPPGGEGTVKRLEPQATACFRQSVAAGNRPRSNPALTYRVRIAASGAVSHVGIFADLSPPGVASCIQPSVASLPFAAPPRDTTVLIQLSFFALLQP